MKLKTSFAVFLLAIVMPGPLSCQSKSPDQYLADKNVIANMQFELNYDAWIPDPIDPGHAPLAKSKSRLKTVEILEIQDNTVLHKIWYEFDPAGKPVYSTYDREKKNQPVRFTYDKSHRLISVDDPPRYFIYTYDSANRQTSLGLRGVYTEKIMYTDTAVIMERTEIKGLDIQPSGSLTTIPNKKTVQVIKYNDQKRMVYKWQPSFRSEERHEYDQAGNLVASVISLDKLNMKIRFYYDARGLLIKKEGYENNKPDMTVTYNYSFKMDGDNIALELIKDTRYASMPEENKKTNWQYLFDTKGNWIKKSEEGSPVVTTRKIEYY